MIKEEEVRSSFGYKQLFNKYNADELFEFLNKHYSIKAIKINRQCNNLELWKSISRYYKEEREQEYTTIYLPWKYETLKCVITQFKDIKEKIGWWECQISTYGDKFEILIWD